ncbi:hypothetical protein [Thermolongibacillus altinsuensis]|uniref:hypothetical protein n=1 Tax=Thermolongibacillus altinsuensis TaxID=575256 RepID=UPI00242A2B6F|nr:hypothetical protein [Thermolongibacillus altinsuensis]GMB09551.1 hypothetical protein B1no1_22610 [Thermolongibacillus altinsuensis]
MSITTANMGQNISNAVYVLRETYKNLNLLFSELDRIGEKEGFIPITPRFLRWKSDLDFDGWLISNFIKLYQLEKDPPLKNIPHMKGGYLYGIEIDLGENEYPIISLIRYNFDYSGRTRIPTVSDHWVFWDPFRVEKFFEINENEGLWTSTPLEKVKDRYWGIQNAIAKEIPLLSVTSPEDIRTKIFQELENLSII